MIGGKGEVAVVVPAGVEPHEYEPTPQDIAAIYAADVFVVNGAGIDAWALKIRPDLEKNGVKVLVMSEILGFNEDSASDAAVDEDSGVDPHFWLDPKLVEQELASIGAVVSAVDTKNQDVYTENTITYTKKIQSIDDAYRKGLLKCANKTVVTSHNAFAYMGKRYQFETLSITGFSPESEPSTRQLADLATLARQKNIQHIFFETLVSPRLAQTLADEIGAKTLVFNPLEGLSEEEIGQGKDYISVMTENLNNLQIAMQCYEQ